MNKKVIAILGGGLAGLSAGIFLTRQGHIVHIFEKENQLGGLVGGREFNGNIYEYGPHFFHTNIPEILSEIKNTVGEELIKFERTILIKFGEEYFKYPLSILEVLKKLPKKVFFKALLSFLKYNLLKLFKRNKDPNSETVLLNFFGDVLYKLFFKDYIFRVWGIYPDKFSPDFAKERIPNITASIFINKLISPFRKLFSKKNTKNFTENVEGALFTTKSGYKGIVNKLQEEFQSKGGFVHFNSEVTKIIYNEKIVNKIEYIENKVENSFFDFDFLINTLPLNNLLTLLSPIPEQSILKSADNLQFRAVVFVGFLINKPKVLPVSFMYFRDHSFNRIYDSSHFNHDTNIDNSSIIVAEISTSTESPFWNDEKYSIEAVKKDLFKEKIIEEKDIIEIHTYRYEFGYPVYYLGYEKDLDIINGFIYKNLKNIKTCGRQGLYQYVNGHLAMKMGIDAAKEIVDDILDN